MSIDFLHRTPLFAGFEESEFLVLLDAAFVHSFDADHVVLRSGEPNRSLFFLVSGAARVEQQGDDGPVVLATLGPGACFGEMSLVDGGRATATVRTEIPTEVLELPGRRIEVLLERRPELAAKFWRNVARVLKQRLVRTNELVGQQVEEDRSLLESREYRDLLGRS